MMVGDIAETATDGCEVPCQHGHASWLEAVPNLTF